jgi:PPOX class probable F420-dependent enzyme
MRARVMNARVARLATTTVQGDPHVVPVCFAVEGDRLYTAVDDVKAKSTAVLRRLLNLAAHPRASVLVDHYAEDWGQLWWVRVDGHAVVAAPGAAGHATAVALLVAKYEQYRRDPPPGPAILVEIDTWRAWP